MNPNNRPTSFRIRPNTSTSLSVNPTAGVFKAGLISRMSIATRGQAEGHDLWLDREFLRQTAAAINRKPVKARLGHPSIGKGAEGSALGHFRDAVVAGDHVYADLHLLQAAHDSPHGDLAGYILGMATECPELLGVSVVFEPDVEAEDEFRRLNPKSPDADNVEDYMHARVGKLRAADVVDDPAANPDGMFSVSFTGSLRPTGAARSESRSVAAAAPMPPTRDFLEAGRWLANASKLPLADALSQIAREHPHIYIEHVSRAREVAGLAAENRQLEGRVAYLRAKIAQKRGK